MHTKNTVTCPVRRKQVKARLSTGKFFTRRKTIPMTQTKQPALVAYSVEDARKGRKAYWTKIGRLFAHDDAKGFDLVLNVQKDALIELLQLLDKRDSATHHKF